MNGVVSVQDSPVPVVRGRNGGLRPARLAAAFIHRWKYVVIAGWIVAIATGAAFVMPFLSHTSVKFAAPKHSNIAAAEEAFERAFPAVAGSTVMQVLIALEDHDDGNEPRRHCGNRTCNVTDVPAAKVFSAQFTSLVAAHASTMFPGVQIAVSNYFDLAAYAPGLASQFLSADGQALSLTVTVGVEFTSPRALDVAEALEGWTAEAAARTNVTFIDAAASHRRTFPSSPPPPPLETVGSQPVWRQLLVDNSPLFLSRDDPSPPITVRIIALPLWVREMVSSAKHDMAIMDAIVLPLALVILAVAIGGSFRLLIVPLLITGSAIAVSFGLMRLVTLTVSVSTAAPSLMMSTGIAMSIDYSLFILSRFVREVVGTVDPVVLIVPLGKAEGRPSVAAEESRPLIGTDRATAPLPQLRMRLCGVDLLEKIYATAGWTVVVSGVTLLISFAALIFMPVQVLQSFGIGCALTVGTAILAAVTFAPAVLAAGEDFFVRGARGADLRALKCLWAAVTFRNQQEAHVAPTASSRCGMGDVDNDEMTISRSWFFRLRRVMAFPWCFVVPLAILGVAAGLGIPTTLHMRLTDSFLTFMGRGGGSAASVGAIQRHYGLSWTMPYKVLFLVDIAQPPTTDDNKVSGVLDVCLTREDVWDRVLRVMDEFAAAAVVESVPHNVSRNWRYDTFGPLTTGFGAAVNRTRLQRCLTVAPFPFGCDEDATMIALASQFVLRSPAGGTNASCADAVGMYLVWLPGDGLDPTGPSGFRLYRQIEDIASAFNALPPAALSEGKKIKASVDEALLALRVYVTGVGPLSVASVDVIYADFPTVVGVAAAVVFLLVGVTFRSPTIPLRAIASIAATELVAFGLAIAAYQGVGSFTTASRDVGPSLFAWTTWASLQGRDGAVPWIVPIVSFTVIVGLALDYDVFLVTGVVEERERLMARMSADPTYRTRYFHGPSAVTREAVMLALCKSGSVITAAGIIMSVAFFGLILSSVPALNTLGFMLVVAALFDTFVVRVVLVPGLMSLFGDWNWGSRFVGKTDV